METLEEAPFELRVWEGDVQAPFEADESELLEDLFAVIEAVNLKPVRLTKSGIPPKPLWSAINQRLIWRDPSAVLYDWEEVDQVRFAYLMALALDLIRSDADLWIHTGPGADTFFTASAIERARMVRRAYLTVLDWDERCDARNQTGNRHNFGKAYRRDFVFDVPTMRETVLGLLDEMPQRQWVRLDDLARMLSDRASDLLISEVCEPPAVGEDGVDPEKLRFLLWWFTLLGRFGWVDMGRLASDSEDEGRLCRLTALGSALVHGTAWRDEPTPLLLIGLDGCVAFPQERPAASARYLSRALGHASGGSRSRRATYRIDTDSLERAAHKGADIVRLRGWIERHVEELPAAISDWLDGYVARPARVRLVQNVLAVEVDVTDADLAARLQEAGFTAVDGLVLADAVRTPLLVSALGGEPWDGFDYPPDQPLAAWKAGPSFHLYFSVLPLQHRGLLLALEVEGDPPIVHFSTDKLRAAQKRGWTVDGIVASLSTLTEKPPSGKILAQLRALAS